VIAAPHTTALQLIEKNLLVLPAVIVSASGRLMPKSVKKVNHNYGSSIILVRAEVIL